jgi:sRNA-binding regulator protein Hfq
MFYNSNLVGLLLEELRKQRIENHIYYVNQNIKLQVCIILNSYM